MSDKKCDPCNGWMWLLYFVIVLLLICLVLAIVLSIVLIGKPTAAVATDVGVCSKMAGKVLKMNGTAVDAAITAMLCVGAVNPQSSGIGGGGFMVVYDPSIESIHSFNFREMAPAASTFDMFNSSSILSEVGGLAVAVPGELKGMKLVHNKYGSLPWKELFEPVIKITRDGFSLTEHSANAIEKAVKKYPEYLANNPVFQGWYYDSEGNLKQAGDIVQRPKYANLLSMIAEGGPEILYKGDIAKEIVDEVQADNGIMTLEDLDSYSASESAPLMVSYNDMEVYASPAPSGGANLLFALNVMEKLGLSPESVDENLTYQRLVETFKYMFAKRSYLGDPYCPACAEDYESILQNQAEMISEEYALTIDQLISNSQTFDPPYYLSDNISPDGGTSHISIVDSTGMAVAVTTTINNFFGSKLITQSGIVLNNQMADFSFPTDTNNFELEPSEANFVRPQKQPLSSTCPTIVLKQDKEGRKFPYLTIGASGGTRIPTALTQVSLGVFSYGQSLSYAIEDRRLHVDFNNNIVYAESGYPNDIVLFLKSLGHNVEMDMEDSPFAVVQGVRIDSDGTITAHSDSRKGGEAYIVPC